MINKPSGLLVHRSDLDKNETRFAVQILRDQIGQSVNPVHRLDKGTSGALIFGLNKNSTRMLCDQFKDSLVQKKYVCIVRGEFKNEFLVNYPLKEEVDENLDSISSQNKPPQEAVTLFKPLAVVDLPIQVDKFPSSRYSLVEAFPKTGRKHQIRRHLRHLGFPIIGDANYGVGKHNRFFAEKFGFRRLLLHCEQLSLQIPSTGPSGFQNLIIHAPWGSDLFTIAKEFGWERHVL